MNAFIAGVGAYVPPRRVSNDELATRVDTSDEWIYSHTGIRYRHLADENQSAADLAVPAAQQAMERAGVRAADIGLVLVATSTPDYLGLPSTACLVQERLELPHAGAMDVMAACTGFIYALETARTFVVSGAARNVLVIGTEVFSKILNWEDRRSCVLFGDGAGAVVVSAAPDGDERWIGPAILGSEGSGSQALMRSHGGTRNPVVPGVTPEAETKLFMDGRAVYNFAVKAVVVTIQRLLHQNNLGFEALDWVVPHQANERIIAAAAKRAGWDAARFYLNIEEYANTSAASIPIALNEMLERGVLKPGALTATVGFGGGLTWGGSLIRW